MPKKFLTKEGLDNVLAAVETRYGPLLTHNHDSKYLGLTATAADSDKLDGKHLSEIVPRMYYDSNSGTGGILIATDLLSIYSQMTLVEIRGNGYQNGNPIDSTLQFYNYPFDNAILGYRAINNGKDIGPFSVFVQDGVLKIWMPRVGPFVTLYVTIRTASSSLYNHVTSITQAEMPTEGVSRLVTVTPSNAVRAQGTATQFIMGDGSLKPLTDIADSYYDKTTADGRFARLGMANNFVYAGNEVSIVPEGYDNDLWINYRAGNGYGHIFTYNIGDGNQGYADVMAKSFKVNGGTASQFMKADGSLDSNAYVNKAEADGRFAALSHTHANLYQPDDKRSVATKPNDYRRELKFTGMKYSSAIGGNGESAYMNGFGWRGWSDSSGGNAWEIFGSDSSLFCRNGATETWGEWNKFLTDKNYQGLLDTRYFHAGNMGSGSGLNADMLDGYHAGMANGNAAVFAAFPDFGTLISQGYLAGSYASDGHPNNKYFEALVKWCADTYPNGGNLIGSATPSSQGLCMINLYAGKTAEGFPNYCSGVYLALNGVTSVFGTEQGVWKWNIGNWNGKANSAWDSDKFGGRLPASYMRIDEMSTARNLDANNLTNPNTLYTTTGDIGGWSTAFTNFPTAKPIGSFFLINIREGAYKKQIYSAYKDNHLYVRRSSYLNGEHWGEWEKVAFTGDNVASADRLSDNGTYTAWGRTFFENGKPKNVSDSLTLFTGSPTTGGWAREVQAKDSAGNDLGGFGFYGNDNALEYAYIGNSYAAPWVAVTPAGNVGIGTPTPAYPLEVNGDGRFATGLIVGTVPSGANVPMLGIYSQRDIVTGGNVTAQNGVVDTLLVNAQGMLFKLSNSMIIDMANGPEAGTQSVPFAKVYVKEIHLGGATFTYDEATDSVICDKTIGSAQGVSCLVEE